MPLTLDFTPLPFGAAQEPEPAVKACTGTCGQVLPLEAFGPKKRGRLGRKAQCRPCLAAADAERQRDPAVKARKAAYHAAWYAENRERMAAWYAENREDRLEYARSRRTDPATRDHVLARGRLKKQRRRARVAAAQVDTFTYDDLLNAWDEAGYGGCYWCDEAFTDADPLHVDHLVPLARGGSHTIANLVPAHASCNTSKGAKDPFAYALERYPWMTAPLTGEAAE